MSEGPHPTPDDHSGGHRAGAGTAPGDGSDRRGRIVVVGPCASGKTTLVGGLRSLGYQAAVCGQEHSEIPNLWRRSAPDVLIALDVDLATIRQRRGAGWSEAIFAAQRRRLENAVAAADLVLDVSRLSEAAVLARVLRALDGAGLVPAALRRRQGPRDA